MIAGVGVDLVHISEIQRLLEDDGDAFAAFAFTEAERAYAAVKGNPAEHLAACFAVKEAVTKALSAVFQEPGFDMRCIECAHRPDGCPYVVPEGTLGALLAAHGLATPHISITHDGDCAIAFAVCEYASAEN